MTVAFHVCSAKNNHRTGFLYVLWKFYSVDLNFSIKGYLKQGQHYFLVFGSLTCKC